MTRNRSLRRLVATAALLAALVFGACGGGDDSDADTASGATETTAPASSGASEDEGTDSATSGDAVDIVDFSYKPENLKVSAGTTVTFTNSDKFAHTVTAKDKSFDSGNMDEGDTFEHTFDEPGTYDYFCSIHNSMTGSVTVS